ncbi:MAG: hypothetical protein M0Z46_00505 [Actinomycetota bacterium]|nr:hypothetical protein [Actinomycetota bacterium]
MPTPELVTDRYRVVAGVEDERWDLAALSEQSDKPADHRLKRLRHELIGLPREPAGEEVVPEADRRRVAP